MDDELNNPSYNMEDVNEQILAVSSELTQLRIKRDQHWARLKRARTHCPTPNTYHVWLEQQWGLKVILDNNSMITDEYTVVDDARYLLYLLKFGS